MNRNINDTNIVDLIKSNVIDLLSLVLSLVAIFVSIKSCSDSNRALEISEKQSKPFIQVTNPELIEPIGSASFIEMKLTLKNTGQVPANDIKIEFDYSTEIGNIVKDGNSATRKNIGSIGQGYEKSVILRSNKRNIRMWKINNRFPDILYFYGTVFYQDDLNEGVEKKVDWVYELRLDSEEALRTKKLVQSEQNKFKSKYDQNPQ